MVFLHSCRDSVHNRAAKWEEKAQAENITLWKTVCVCACAHVCVLNNYFSYLDKYSALIWNRCFLWLPQSLVLQKVPSCNNFIQGNLHLCSHPLTGPHLPRTLSNPLIAFGKQANSKNLSLRRPWDFICSILGHRVEIIGLRQEGSFFNEQKEENAAVVYSEKSMKEDHSLVSL